MRCTGSTRFAKGSSEVENHLIDALSAGRISRKEFIRRGTVLGLSLSALSFIASACGGDDDDGSATGATGATEGQANPGGTLRTGIIAPAIELNPLVVYDEGGLAVLGQSGEYLAWSNDQLELEPRLAESWTPNEDGSIWTFKIRQGVTFHDCAPLAATDVAYTLNLNADPKNEGNALSAFGDPGGSSAGGAEAIDDATLVVTLNGPNGSFPYLVSSDNYNVIVVPDGFDPATWEKSFMGTGPRGPRHVYASAGRDVHEESQLLGHPAPAARSTRASSASTRKTRPGSSRSRAARSTSSASSRSSPAARRS